MVPEVNQSFSHGKVMKSGEILPLCCLMYCADCDFKLKKNTTFHESKKRGKYKLVTYICNTYANYGKEVCSSHSILQRVIEDENDKRQRYMAITEHECKQQTED